MHFQNFKKLRVPDFCFELDLFVQQKMRVQIVKE
ncbi:unnamed protein product [Brassica oleracea]|uniref:(rape) hypothetical protein n=1 Tax=Brassica napus TaxID=3708 RepID=A0A816JTE0_BRANA|nr:unnamed protein product [Brassica napus]